MPNLTSQLLVERSNGHKSDFEQIFTPDPPQQQLESSQGSEFEPDRTPKIESKRREFEILSKI